MAGIRVELELASGEFTSRMIHAGETVRQFQANVGQAIVGVRRMHDVGRGFLSTLRDLSIITGTFGLAIGLAHRAAQGWAGQIVQVNAEMERLQVLLASMSSAADPFAEAAQNVRWLRDFAKQAPYSLTALTNAFVKMKATGIDPINGSLQAFVDGVAAAGGSEEMLNRAAIAISQMSGKGVIQMEELRQQLGEAIPRAIELMARSMGTTYSDLVQQISTGRVLAQPALQALAAELDRTFGGAALSMMDTFSGQIQKTKTLLQDLALRVGQTRYFDAVKDQLSDLNDFLGGSAADALAERLGQALASIVEGFRNVIDFVVEFRQEIVLTAKVLAGAFLAKIALNGLLALGRGIQTIRAQLAQFALQYRVMQQQMATNSILAMYGPGATVQAGVQGISRTTQAFRNMGSALSVVGTGLSFVGGLAVPLAGAIMLAANAFGFFSDKARDAWQELEEFGAQSLEQVEQAGELLARKEAELLRMYEEVRHYYGTFIDPANPPDGEMAAVLLESARRAVPGIDALEAEVFAMRQQYAEWTTDAIEIEADKATRALMRRADREIAILRGAYDRESIEAQEALEERLRLAAENGESITEIREEHQEAQRGRELQLYEDQIAVLQRYYDEVEATVRDGTDAQAAQIQAQLDEIAAKIVSIQGQKDAVMDSPMGIQLSPDLPNEEELIEKARGLLTGLQTDIAGVRAEFAGANDEVAKFLFELSQGMYGDADTEQVRELADAIVLAQEEFKRLQELLEGRDQFRDDIDSALANAQRALIEERVGTLNDLQRIAIDYWSGNYAGIGPAAAPYQDLIRTLTEGFSGVSTNATAAGEAMTTGPFSPTTIGAGNDLLTLIGQLTNGWANFQTLVNGTDVAGALRVDGTGALVPSGDDAAFIASRRANQNISLEGLDAEFMRRLAEALRAAEAETGEQASIISLVRTFEQQQRLYQQYLRGEIGLAAPPGSSRHEIGAAADLAAGAVLSWLHENADAFGLAFLTGTNFTNDPGHIQMALGPGNMAPRAGTVPMTVPASTPNLAANINVQNVGDLQALIDAMMSTVTDPELLARLQEVQRLIDETERARSDGAITQAIDDLLRDFQSIQDGVAGAGEAVQRVYDAIRSGEFGADTDVNSSRYAALIAQARELDLLNARIEQDEEDAADMNRINTDLAQQRLEISRQLEQSARALADPNAVLPTAAYNRLLQQLSEVEQTIRRIYGEGSPQLTAFIMRRNQLLADQSTADTLAFAQQFQETNESIRQSLMDQALARQNEHQRDIARMREHLRTFAGTAEQRALIEEMIQERIALARQEAWSEGAFAQAIERWSDFGGNLQTAFVGWVDNMASTLADFLVTGEADWKSFFRSIASELAKLAIQAAFANIFKQLLPGSVGGGGLGEGRPFLQLLGRLFGIAHSGGIVGSLASGKVVDPMVFAGAPRFHTGGIIGGLHKDEVPIIAKRGEGVFTPEQMARLGGTMHSVNVTNNITINGSAGTSEQNDDLARKISREIDGRVRKTVMDELLTQRRPGGALYGKR